MMKKGREKLRSCLALALALALAIPNISWSISADANEDTEENVYFFFDERIVDEDNTVNTEFHVTQATDGMKTTTNLTSCADAHLWKGYAFDDDDTVDEMEAALTEVREGVWPDWEIVTSATTLHQEYDEETNTYKLWRLLYSSPGAPASVLEANNMAGWDWRFKLIDSTNSREVDYDTTTYSISPQGTLGTNGECVAYYESVDGIIWHRALQDEFYYQCPNGKVVRTNIVQYGGFGHGITKNANTAEGEPKYLISGQGIGSTSEQWSINSEDMNSGLGGGIGITWSDDGIHWEDVVTICDYDYGDIFLQSDSWGMLQWSEEAGAYVVVNRSTPLAGDGTRTRGNVVLIGKGFDSIKKMADLKAEELAKGNAKYWNAIESYWTRPKEAIRGTSIYNQPYYIHSTPYEEGYYIGTTAKLNECYDENYTGEYPTHGHVWGELVWSPDLVNWYFMNDGEPFIANADSFGNLEAGNEFGMVYPWAPTITPDGIRVYYDAAPELHAHKPEENAYEPELWEAIQKKYPEAAYTYSSGETYLLRSYGGKFVSLGWDAFGGYSVTDGQTSGTVRTSTFKMTGDTLRFAASSTEGITVKAYDTSGNEVTALGSGTLNANDTDSRGRYAVAWSGDSTQLMTDTVYSFEITISGETVLYSIAGNIEAQELNVFSGNEEPLQFYEVGKTKDLGLKMVPAAKPTDITYSGYNENVITIDEDGFVTSVGAGNTTVSVTLADGRSTTVDVIVNDYPNEHHREGLWTLRSNALSVNHYKTSVSAWGHGSITLYQDVVDALKEGAVIEIGYRSKSTIDKNFWLEDVFADGVFRYLGGEVGGAPYPLTNDQARWSHDDDYSIMQITYEAMDELLRSTWNTNRHSISCGSPEATEIYYVRVGMRTDYEDRTNLYDLTDTIDIGATDSGTLTLTEEMCNALERGAAVEISYDSSAKLTFTTADGIAIDTTIYNGDSTIIQIRYEDLIAAYGTEWNTVGNVLYYNTTDGSSYTILSSMIGMRASYIEGLWDTTTVYEVPSSQFNNYTGNKYTAFYINDTIESYLKENTILEIGYTKSDMNIPNALCLQGKLKETYQENCNGSWDTCSNSGGTCLGPHEIGYIGGCTDTSWGGTGQSLVGQTTKFRFNTEESVMQITYETLAEYFQEECLTSGATILLSRHGGQTFVVDYISIVQTDYSVESAAADWTLNSLSAEENELRISYTLPETCELPIVTEDVLISDAYNVMLDATTYATSMYLTSDGTLELRIATENASTLAKEGFEVILKEDLTSEQTISGMLYKIEFQGGARWQNTARDGMWNSKTYNPEASYYYINSAKGTNRFFSGNNFWIGISDAFQGDASWIPEAYDSMINMSSIVGENLIVDGAVSDSSTQWGGADKCKTSIWGTANDLVFRVWYWAAGSDYWDGVQTAKILSGTESATADGTKVIVFKGDFDMARNSAGTAIVAERLSDVRHNGSFYGDTYTQTVTDAETITVNGTAVDNINLTKSGDYEVVVKTSLGNTIQNVIYHKTGDANADGKTTVADILAAKKLVAGITTANNSQALGANISLANAAINNDDVTVLRKSLIGVQDRTNLSELTDYVEVSQDVEISSAWGRTNITITDAMAEKLVSGAILEVGYEYANTIGQDWILEKTLWFTGYNGSNYYEIGYAGSNGAEVAQDEVKWNNSGNVVQVSYDTLNTYLASGWNAAGNTIMVRSTSPCKITYVKVGTPVVVDEEEVVEDRSNLYTLTDVVEVSTSSYVATSTAAYTNGKISLSEDEQALLKEGAVLEVHYNCTDTEAWMENKTLWFSGIGTDEAYHKIGFPAAGGDTIAVGELLWNDSGTIVQITYEQLTTCLANGGKGEFNWQAGGPCTIQSIRIGQRVE